MGQTYEQHKATIDAAHPTPTVAWHQSDADNPAHGHDDYDVAYGETTFMGERFRLSLHVGIAGAMIRRWTIGGWTMNQG